MATPLHEILQWFLRSKKPVQSQFAAQFTGERERTVLFASEENNGFKQNSLTPDTTGTKFPAAVAVNRTAGAITNAMDMLNGQIL